MRRRTDQPTGPARMEDVARRARVSTATVSRTLHKPDMVSDATRRRVQRAIRDIGYVHNLLAGSLATSRTKAIAALVPTFDNRDYAKTIHATADVLRAAGYHLLLMHHGFSVDEEEALESLRLLQELAESYPQDELFYSTGDIPR